MERVLPWLLPLFAICSVARGIDDTCAACYAVAKEIERGISNEKPRNHLDMRHRLDSKGQRVGKVIDYRVSELRIVELLDGLCEKMQGYILEKVDSEQHWIKVDNWDNLTNKLEARAYSKDISSYCGRLLEETEDNLAELIKKGSVEVGDVSKILCEDLSKHCSQTRTSQYETSRLKSASTLKDSFMELPDIFVDQTILHIYNQLTTYNLQDNTNSDEFVIKADKYEHGSYKMHLL